MRRRLGQAFARAVEQSAPLWGIDMTDARARGMVLSLAQYHAREIGWAERDADDLAALIEHHYNRVRVSLASLASLLAETEDENACRN